MRVLVESVCTRPILLTAARSADGGAERVEEFPGDRVLATEVVAQRHLGFADVDGITLRQPALALGAARDGLFLGAVSHQPSVLSSDCFPAPLPLSFRGLACHRGEESACALHASSVSLWLISPCRTRGRCGSRRRRRERKPRP
jgi:hypothetical protein